MDFSDFLKVIPTKLEGMHISFLKELFQNWCKEELFLQESLTPYPKPVLGKLLCKSN